MPPFTFGWPVNETCKAMTSAAASSGGKGLLTAAAAVASAFYTDGTGNASQCFDGIGQ